MSTRAKERQRRIYNQAATETYRIIGGPDIVSDFVELQSRFSAPDLYLGHCHGWIPNGTILERNGKRYIVVKGKILLAKRKGR